MRILNGSNGSQSAVGMRLTRNLTLFLCLFALWSPAIVKAEDVGDPIAGRRLAQAWCSNCHVYPGSGQATATGAPSFPAVAANSAITPLALRAFLQTPHERMPDLHLSNNETDDLIAFVLSTRGQ